MTLHCMELGQGRMGKRKSGIELERTAGGRDGLVVAPGRHQDLTHIGENHRRQWIQRRRAAGGAEASLERFAQVGNRANRVGDEGMYFYFGMILNTPPSAVSR
jgi:hypothetical protein